MSGLYADALATLSRWQAPSDAQEQLRREYVDLLTRERTALARSCYPDHLTASVLVVDQSAERVLLTLHAKAQKWFQFGGHCEPDDPTLVGAAMREGLEESGLSRLDLDPEPVHLSVHEVPFCDPRGGARHFDVRYLAVATDESFSISPESLDVRWWPVDALPTDAGDVAEMVALALRRLNR